MVVEGVSPTVTAVRKDEDGHKGVEITVDNHDGSQPTTVFVKDGAKGETGATGQDGQTPTITTQRGQDGQPNRVRSRRCSSDWVLTVRWAQTKTRSKLSAVRPINIARPTSLTTQRNQAVTLHLTCASATNRSRRLTWSLPPTS